MVYFGYNWGFVLGLFGVCSEKHAKTPLFSEQLPNKGRVKYEQNPKKIEENPSKNSNGYQKQSKPIKFSQM